MHVGPGASSLQDSTIPRRIRRLLVLIWLVTAPLSYVVARHEGWRGLTLGQRPWIFVVVGLPWLAVLAVVEAVFDARQRSTDRAAAPTRWPFVVLRSDRSLEEWGRQGDTRYELDDLGRLRVLLSKKDQAGVTEREARVYLPDEWLEVRRLDG